MDHNIRPLTTEEQVAHQREQQYRDMLAKHDWTFEWSDDARAYARGRDERKALEALQPSVDPAHVIWNEFSPADYRRAEVAA